MTTRLARVCELKKLIADVMDLNPSALEIVDLEEGCVIVTFLIPSTVADALFTPDTVFTPQQEQRLHDNSVIWMRCNGHTFNFEKQQQQQALQKLKEQLTCSICLAIYTDPKQLQCQHAYCQQCLMGLVQQDQLRQPTLTCPTCRQVTPVPASGVAGLQADFRANQLLDVMDNNNRMVGVTTHCKMEIMNSPFSKATVSCLEHDGKDLELFCETCEVTICLKCAVKGGKHHSHDYMDLNEALDKCKSKIESSLVTIEKALAELKAHRDLISDQRAAIAEEIHSTPKMDTEVIDQLYQLAQAKIKSLEAQKDQLQTIQEKLHHNSETEAGSCGGLTLMKSNMVMQVKALFSVLQLDQLDINTEADMELFAKTDTDTGDASGLVSYDPHLFSCRMRKEVLVIGEKTSIILETVNFGTKQSTVSPQFITSFLKHIKTSTISDCSIEQTGLREYKISYQPTITGAHQLHITVQGQHIMGSPFHVTVRSSNWTEFARVKSPRQIAVNKRGEVIVVSWGEYCVSVFSPSGEKLVSFGPRGSSPGHFRFPEGVTVDQEENILVTDYKCHRIQKFTARGKYIEIDSRKKLSLNYPRGLAVNFSNDKLYVTEKWTNQVRILNTDFSNAGKFGKLGKDREEFKHPYHIACDSTKNVYVVDSGNHRIQVFSASGGFLRMFGKHGRGEGELRWPHDIAIDARDRVYVGDWGNRRVSVFTSEGQFSFSIGTEQINNPIGLAVSCDGRVYVCGAPDKVLYITC